MSRPTLVAGIEPDWKQNLGDILRDPLYNIGQLFHSDTRDTVAKMKLAELLDPDIGRPGHAMSAKEVLENNCYDWETGEPEESGLENVWTWRDIPARGGAK